MRREPDLKLPELFHLGWVVRDCAAAQQELRERLGAGPFRSAGEESRFVPSCAADPRRSP